MCLKYFYLFFLFLFIFFYFFLFFIDLFYEFYIDSLFCIKRKEKLLQTAGQKDKKKPTQKALINHLSK